MEGSTATSIRQPMDPACAWTTSRHQSEALLVVPVARAAASGQGPLEAGGVWETVRGVFGETAQDDRFEVVGDAPAERGRGSDGSREWAIITSIPLSSWNGGRPVKRWKATAPSE